MVEKLSSPSVRNGLLGTFGPTRPVDNSTSAPTHKIFDTSRISESNRCSDSDRFCINRVADASRVSNAYRGAESSRGTVIVEGTDIDRIADRNRDTNESLLSYKSASPRSSFREKGK